MSESFITPYGLAMKATVAQIGVLASLPNLIGSLSQLFTAAAVDKLGSRMALITPCVLIHALMWAPIILTPYIVSSGTIAYFIIFIALYTTLNAITLPAWSSLMSDHIPEDRRGSFFGWRNRFLGFVNVGAALSAGFILNRFKGYRFFGFSLIFTAALMSRLISWNFLRKMYEPPLATGDKYRFTFGQFLRRIRVSNFGRFVIFVSVMHFSVMIVSPFLTVYMLKDLGFDYVSYTIITLMAAVTILSAMSLWGVHADRIGNRRVLRFTSMMLPIIPILWILFPNKLYLIFVQSFAGFFWAGFNLSASNFIFDAVTPEKRTRCIAYFNAINGSAIFLGALVGGFVVKYLPPAFGYQILTLALISAVLRAGSAILGSRVKEVRTVKKVSNLGLFYSILGIRPLVNIAGKD